MVYSEEVNVRGNAVPVIIGMNGASIRKLQEEFGVKLAFLGLNTEQYAERPLRIIGPQHNVVNARRRIIDISEGRDLEFYVAPPSTTAPGASSVPTVAASMVTREFFVPAPIANRIVGRNGKNLQNIKISQNLRYVEAEGMRILDDGRKMQQIVLRGSSDDVDNAMKLLQQLTDSHAASQLVIDDENDEPTDEDSVVTCTESNKCRNPKSEIDEDFWNTDTENLTNGALASSSSAAQTPSLNDFSQISLNSNGHNNNINDNVANDFDNSDSWCGNGNNKDGLIVDVGEDEDEPLAYTVKYNPATNGIVHAPTQTEISKFAVRVTSLGEQHNRTIERASRTHCDSIIKAALEFVTNAEHSAQAELRQLRERLHKTEAELAAARTDSRNGSGMFGVEISNLKKKLSQKEKQAEALAEELEQHKCTIEDLTLEVATLKCEQQEQQYQQQKQEKTPTSALVNCKKCSKETMDTILMPCLHLAYCRTCAFSMTSCEVCNARVTSRLKIKAFVTK